MAGCVRPRSVRVECSYVAAGVGRCKATGPKDTAEFKPLQSSTKGADVAIPTDRLPSVADEVEHLPNAKHSTPSCKRQGERYTALASEQRKMSCSLLEKIEKIPWYNATNSLVKWLNVILRAKHVAYLFPWIRHRVGGKCTGASHRLAVLPLRHHGLAVHDAALKK